MGIQGTEVAKGAADMVLRDDNFASIVKAVEKGRIIYAGIQKFVAFIMSVHIAEVVQICFCVLAGMPLMRTPIQILFLILVTDLPPSIALGLEGGDKSILLQKPRPKGEPVVLSWMWTSICGNGVLLSVVIIAVYAAALYKYCDGNIFQAAILPDCAFGDTDCEKHLDVMRDQMNNARTVAFIALVWAENFRAYASRSFDKPFFINVLGNKYMQYAACSAQVALYIAVLVPGFSDKVLELRGLYIGAWGWLFALTGPVGTMVFCELFKLLVTARQLRSYERTKKNAASPDQMKAPSPRAATTAVCQISEAV
jgi:magnesium-transporting ATPase (P-type)